MNKETRIELEIFWEALLLAQADGFITMEEARAGYRKYEREINTLCAPVAGHIIKFEDSK